MLTAKEALERTKKDIKELQEITLQDRLEREILEASINGKTSLDFFVPSNYQKVIIEKLESLGYKVVVDSKSSSWVYILEIRWGN